MKGLFRVAAFVTLAVLSLPAASQAAMRYTAPAGTGTGCTESNPCSLAEGVNGAAADDEVRMTADEYILTSQLVIGVRNLTISGPPGRYSPEQDQAFMMFRGGAVTVANILVQAEGFTLRRVSIDGQSGGQIVINAITDDNMTLDRVRVFDNGSAGTVAGQDALVINSVIRQDAGTGPAVNITGAIIGSTITSATQTAIINDDAFHVPPDHCSLQVLNTIAIGAVRNLEAVDGGSGCDPTIEYAYSWIPVAAGFGGGGIAPSAFITAGEGNLPDSPPALPLPFTGTIELALDSPAINAGCGGSCGNEDFYGRPRPIGAGNDIGATEAILPPTISTASVGTVTSTSAPVSTTINPNGGATTYNFQIRKVGTSEWESFDGGTTGEGASDTSVSGRAIPLDPSTDYEVRVLGANSAGESSGAPVTFRTADAPSPPPSVSVKVVSAKVKGRTGITLRVRTSGAGRVVVRGTYAPGAASARRVACIARTTVRRDGTHTMVCRFNARTRTVLVRRPLRMAVRATFTPTGGDAVSTSRNVRVKRFRP